MDRYLTPEHVRLQARVRRFALEAVVPVARELDETAAFPWENVKLMSELGFLGVPVAGVIFSALWLGEPLTATLLAGLVLIVAGMALVNLQSRGKLPSSRLG